MVFVGFRVPSTQELGTWVLGNSNYMTGSEQVYDYEVLGPSGKADEPGLLQAGGIIDEHHNWNRNFRCLYVHLGGWVK